MLSPNLLLPYKLRPMLLLRSYATISDLIFGLTGLRIPLPIFSFGFFVESYRERERESESERGRDSG